MPALTSVLYHNPLQDNRRLARRVAESVSYDIMNAIGHVNGPFDLLKTSLQTPSTLFIGLYRDEGDEVYNLLNRCCTDLQEHLHQTAVQRLRAVHQYLRCESEILPIRKLVLRDPHLPEYFPSIASVDVLYDVIRRLNLEAARFEDVNFVEMTTFYPQSASALGDVFRRDHLTSLSLQSVTVPLHFFASCPSLKNLELKDVDIMDTRSGADQLKTASCPLDARPTCQLESLFDHNSAEAFRLLICSLAVDAEFGQIRTLGMDWGCQEGVQLGWDLVKHNAPHLRNLILKREFRQDHKVIYPAMPVDFELGVIPNLRSLELGDVFNPTIFGFGNGIVSVLQSLPESNDLRHLRIVLSGVPYTGDLLKSWKNHQDFLRATMDKLDAVLAGKQFRNVTEINFHISYDVDFEDTLELIRDHRVFFGDAVLEALYLDFDEVPYCEDLEDELELGLQSGAVHADMLDFIKGVYLAGLGYSNKRCTLTIGKAGDGYPDWHWDSMEY